MKPIAIIFHAAESSPGVIVEAARSRNIPIQEIRPYLGEAFPPPDTFSAIVSLGGPQGAYQTDQYPYLQTEADYLREVLNANIPLLAICLGSQILACSAGGDAYPGVAGLEAGVIEVVGWPEGREFSGHFLSFHSDAASVPPEAEVVAESEQYIQAWRLGSALAIQFHPELDSENFEGVLDYESEKLKNFGVDVDELIEGVRDYSEQIRINGFRIIDLWFQSWEKQLTPAQHVSQQGGKNA